MLIANLTITTAVSAQTTTVVPFTNGAFQAAIVQANFTYGSGGTSVDAWVQTTFDGGSTWCDVAEFSFTTASARKLFLLNANVAGGTIVTPTDGSLSANTSNPTLVGNSWRVKYTTVGTYAGGTTLRVDLAPRGTFGGAAT